MKTIKNNKKSINASNFQILSKHQLGLLVGGEVEAEAKDKTTPPPTTTTTPTTGSGGGTEGTTVSNPIVFIKK